MPAQPVGALAHQSSGVLTYTELPQSLHLPTVMLTGKWLLWVLTPHVAARASRLKRLLWLRASETLRICLQLDAVAEQRHK